ncbi:hypothetical protein AYI69_g5091 [Smittium culicis]|uniref:Uncharacterized protein n=1 Tax=Smittium culicis TaxID=133412 RepID=A0A1R1Y923_9FUNG|nr:hypothetical protein AYI69_g5091 [Smittium culicis]
MVLWCRRKVAEASLINQKKKGGEEEEEGKRRRKRSVFACRDHFIEDFVERDFDFGGFVAAENVADEARADIELDHFEASAQDSAVHVRVPQPVLQSFGGQLDVLVEWVFFEH